MDTVTVTTLQQKSYNMRRKDFGIKLLMNVNLQAPSLDVSFASPAGKGIL